VIAAELPIIVVEQFVERTGGNQSNHRRLETPDL
jgi:hypothetical protein